MKESLRYDQLADLSTEQGAAQQRQLKTIQNGLLLGWGSILTYMIMALSYGDPFGVRIGSAFLWLMLLFAPGAGALFIWKWPTWQEVPLLFRRPVILSGLALSWATYLSFVVFQIAWNSDDIGFITVISGIGVGLGLGVLFTAKRLHKQVIQDGEFFP